MPSSSSPAGSVGVHHDVIAALISPSYATVGACNDRWGAHVKSLLHSRRMPDGPWKEPQIERWLMALAAMDCNNRDDIASVGEREGRVYSPLVSRRHFGFAHGIGRSGDLTALQPKAPGSSLLFVLTTKLVKDILVRGCGISKLQGDPLITPVATGLTLSLCLQHLLRSRRLHDQKDAEGNAKSTRVIMSRIDQKSALKAVQSTGLVVDLIPQIWDADTQAFRTDTEAIKEAIDRHPPGTYLAIVTCTSCFAPRSPDNVVAIAEFASSRGIGHVVNNAYGLGCSKTTQSLQDACHRGRIDFCVQSLDKNFLVPVSGAVIFSNQPGIVADLAESYPGRASGSHIIDLHATFLSMGRDGTIVHVNVVLQYVCKRSMHQTIAIQWIDANKMIIYYKIITAVHALSMVVMQRTLYLDFSR